jgi:2-methylisocitrate lyase-like PEP mutase family enzyme
MTKAERFHALHVAGNPLVLFNAWDAGSARAIENAGALAIATSSWSVAAARGFGDGERMPRAIAIDALRQIAAATQLPVTADLEAGYGSTAADVRETAALAIEAGAVGCNLEDAVGDDGTLRDARGQATRIAAIRDAADAAGVRFFINARTDVFLQSDDAPQDDLVAEVVARARVYEEAGAGGIFTPGLEDLVPVAKLAGALSLPLNVMLTNPSADIRSFASCGVARISFGPAPYLAAMSALEAAAHNVFHSHPSTQKEVQHAR